MPGKAFLLGRNGDEQLRWCCRFDDHDKLRPCDVQRMGAALGRHGYDVCVAREAWTEGTILDRLKAAMGDSGGETFLFYFSGHSVLLEDGLGLGLVLKRDAAGTDYFPVGRVIDLFKHNCPAAYKLIVLDCCYAGEAAAAWKPGVHENLRILAASDRATVGKEIEDLQGGVLTYCLHQALTNPNYWVSGGTGVVDGDGVIWSDALAGWLKREVKALGRRYRVAVGAPIEYFLVPTLSVGMQSAALRRRVMPAHGQAVRRRAGGR